LQKNRFIYPFLVSFAISTLSFPDFTGKFQASEIGTHDQIHDLFINYTWSRNYTEMTVEEWKHVRHWRTPHTGVFENLLIYILMTFFLSIVAATLPVPTGVLIPTFKVGAAFGRLVGEAMHLWLPGGLREGGVTTFIAPGGYATVGAAAFSGAVTHTISISVIVFEMTGQITHCIPVLIAVLIANAIASLLQPSCYDSIIMIKKLPYLPDILPASSGAYNLYVDDFMVREIKYIWYGMTYRELREVLKAGAKLRGFPLVDNPDHMILLGSIQRTELIAAIEKHIGRERRMQEAATRFEDEVKRRREREMRRKEEEEQRKIKLKLEEEARKREEEEAKRREEEDKLKLAAESQGKERRPSRFEVTTEAGAVFVPASSVPPAVEEEEEGAKEGRKSSIEEKYGIGLDPDSPAMRALQQLSSKPKKSILKKSNSYTIHAFGIPGVSPHKRILPERNSGGGDKPKKVSTPQSSTSPYQTVTGAESRLRSALGSLFKRPSAMSVMGGSARSLNAAGGSGAVSPNSPFRKSGGYRMDMTLAEQRRWEQEQLDKSVDFDSCHIDPAPFQLVEKTSLLKVHSLFSMLGVNHAYVTAIGRLIGVVGLKELRTSIEEANSGQSARRVEERQRQDQEEEGVKDDHVQLTVDSADSAFSGNGGATNGDESSDYEVNIHSAKA